MGKGGITKGCRAQTGMDAAGALALAAPDPTSFELVPLSEGQPYRTRLWHGTRSSAQLRAIRSQGFVRRAGVTFATSFQGEAASYAGERLENTLPVQVELRQPLVIRVDEGERVLERIAQAVPDMQPPAGGDLGAHNINSLRAQGYDGIVIRYPASESDPSNRMPQRDIVRIFAEGAIDPLDPSAS